MPSRVTARHDAGCVKQHPLLSYLRSRNDELSAGRLKFSEQHATEHFRRQVKHWAHNGVFCSIQENQCHLWPFTERVMSVAREDSASNVATNPPELLEGAYLPKFGTV